MTGENRPVPVVDEDSHDFWHGGADGRLLISGCTACGQLFHPPARICPHCYSRSIATRPVSGRGTVESYTVVRHAWVPGYEQPYIVARVVLIEQPDVRLLTNVVDCEVEAVATGMAVQVAFEQRGDVFVPMFRPVV